MKKSLAVLLLVALLLSITPVLAQGGDTLTLLCTPQEDWCVAMTQAFQEQTGIVTSYVRMSSGEALARLRATAGNPEFSVWWGGPADTFFAAADEGLLEPYDSPNAQLIDPKYRDAEGKTWTGVYVGVLGFCSNKQILEELGVEPPTSWQDLLNPALQGNVAMAHPATSGTAFTAFWTNVTLAADALERAAMEEQGMDEEAIAEALAAGEYVGAGYDETGAPTQEAIDNAFAYFAQLHQNILQYTRSGAAPGRMAGAGEIAVAIIFSHDCVKLQQEGFADILVTTFPEEGTGYEIGGMAIIKGAAEPEAARAWYEWALTAEAQAIGPTVNSLQLPTNPEAPVSELSVKLDEVNLLNYNFVAAGANRTAIVERFDAEIAPEPVE
ncbi:MAG: ABC transporter substrate-binding protein [Anaerolineae bacterium]|nr:ABC transporter substrate-binding protein [Anaerolineae bacterium]